MKAIGIDLGTTSICGVVIDTQTGQVVRSRTENSNAFIKTENSWEKIQDPEKIINIATGILDDFITEDTVVIGVTGQMHGIVYTDRQGIAISPLYTWQDGRGNLPYNNTTYAEHMNSHSGYGNVTHFYNCQNGLVPAEAKGFCTIHDYLVMHICGLHSALIHVSDAASFGCFDLEKGEYSCSCDVTVINDYHIAGNYKGIPVSVAIGDNQASVFSSLANDDDILLNVGTGSQISVVSDRAVWGDGIETRPYFEGKYLIVGAALCGGRAYAVLKDFYKKIISYVTDADDKAIYDIMDKMLSESDETLKVDTRFSGTRGNEGIRGSITGISTENFTPAALTDGLLCGMVEELFGMYCDMDCKRNGLVGSGNGIRKNPYLIKVAENRFGASLKIPAHTEEAAYGAALFALISSGYFTSSKEAKKLINYL